MDREPTDALTLEEGRERGRERKEEEEGERGKGESGERERKREREREREREPINDLAVTLIVSQYSMQHKIMLQLSPICMYVCNFLK